MAAVQAPKMKINTEPLKAIEAQLDSAGKFVDKRNEIIARICIKLQPLVRRLLLDELRRSGLKTGGELEKLVSQAILIPTRKGLHVGEPRGKTPDQYKKMGGLQHGYIRNLAVQSARTRKKIKAAAVASGGSKVVKAHPYFQLGGAAMGQVETAFNAMLQDELNRFMAAQARGG